MILKETGTVVSVSFLNTLKEECDMRHRVCAALIEEQQILMVELHTLPGHFGRYPAEVSRTVKLKSMPSCEKC